MVGTAHHCNRRGECPASEAERSRTRCCAPHRRSGRSLAAIAGDLPQETIERPSLALRRVADGREPPPLFLYDLAFTSVGTPRPQ